MGESNGLFHFAMDYVAGVDAARLQAQHRRPLADRPRGGPGLPGAPGSGLCARQGFRPPRHQAGQHAGTQNGGREVVKLTDFGLARVYKASKMSGLTMNGDLGGTAAYIAPEQISEVRTPAPGRPVQHGRDALQAADRPLYLRPSEPRSSSRS